MSAVRERAAVRARPGGEQSPRAGVCGPIKVMVLDVEHLPQAVSAVRGAGGRYDALWALVRRGGRPAALIKLPFAGDRLSAEELAACIDDQPSRSTAPSPSPDGVVALARRLPRISVIVPTTFKRLEDLQLTLESLEALDYPDFEILLVDNRVEGVRAIPGWVELLPAVRVLSERRPGISAARNRGLSVATGELVAFTDDDVTVDEHWLSAVADRFAKHPEEACVTGLVLPRELETPAQVRLEQYYGGFGPRLFSPVSHRLEPRARGGIFPRAAPVVELDGDGNPLRTFSLYAAGTFGMGANMAFRADAVRAVGGFDETLGVGTPARGGEDLSMFVQLAWRGHGLGFEPAAMVHHTHRRDERSLRSQLEAYGVGFTAMLLALAREDRAHIGAMLATIPIAARSLGSCYWRKLHPRRAHARATADSAEGAEIAGLARLELRGMARGPFAYARSRRLVRSVRP